MEVHSGGVFLTLRELKRLANAYQDVREELTAIRLSTNANQLTLERGFQAMAINTSRILSAVDDMRAVVDRAIEELGNQPEVQAVLDAAADDVQEMTSDLSAALSPSEPPVEPPV